MTIVRPDLVVTKTGPTSVINLGQWAAFTIDVWNRGTSTGNAWNVNIVDLLPSNSSNPINGGMCDLTPEVTGVTLAGTPLTLGTDYSLSYAGCQLSLALLGTADRKIGTNEHLIISYRTKVDADSLSGAVLTNVAAATQWSSEKDSTLGQTYACTPTNGTVGIDDCQDAHNLLVALSGYFFEKTAANPATGAIVSTALAGETLHVESAKPQRPAIHRRSFLRRTQQIEPVAGIRAGLALARKLSRGSGRLPNRQRDP
jgi:uncharacterized repeat protein (TIGR01451 family)